MKINIFDVKKTDVVFPVLRKWINDKNIHLVVLFFDKTNALVVEKDSECGFNVGEIKQLDNAFDFSTWQPLQATVKLEINCNM